MSKKLYLIDLAIFYRAEFKRNAFFFFSMGGGEKENYLHGDDIVLHWVGLDYIETYLVEVPSLPMAKTWTQTPTS